MASVEHPLTEADILTQVVAPGKPDLPPEVARSILKMRFNDEASKRMQELMDKNNQGTISESETAEMDKYLRVGTFLDLIQAKAHLSLKHASTN